MESEIYYCVHYSQSLVTTLSYTLSSYTFKLKFNIIISSTPRSSKLVSSCKSLPIETLCTSAGEPMALLSACRCGKVSLTRGIHFCPSYFLCPTSVCILWIYVYIHIYDRVENVYELPLLSTFSHKPRAVRSVYWIFIIGVLARRWLGEYMILDKKIYILTFKQEVVAAPVTSTSFSSSHSSRKTLFEI